MKTARKDNKTVWKIHTFVWKKENTGHRSHRVIIRVGVTLRKDCD